MKHSKALFLFILLSLFFTGVVIYTSCKKDACMGVVCRGGGWCTNGICSCPAGYSGARCEESSVIFANNTYTPITLIVNGTPSLIQVAGTYTVSGTTGSTVGGYAYTPSPVTQHVLGSVVHWNFNVTFPASGAIPVIPLNVPADSFFYLQIVDSNIASSLVGVRLSYGTADSVEPISIPNDGNLYGVGYFPYTSGLIYISGYSDFSQPAHWNWPFVSVPDTANARVVLTAN